MSRRHKDTSCEDDCSQLDRVRELEGMLAQAERERDEWEAVARSGSAAIQAQITLTENINGQLAQAEQRVRAVEAWLRTQGYNEMDIESILTPPPAETLAQNIAKMGSSGYLITTPPPPAEEGAGSG